MDCQSNSSFLPVTHLPWVRVKRIYLQRAHSASAPLVTHRPLSHSLHRSQALPRAKVSMSFGDKEKKWTHILGRMEPVLGTSSTRWLPPSTVSFWKLELQHNVKNYAIDAKGLRYTVLGQKGPGRGWREKLETWNGGGERGAPWEEWEWAGWVRDCGVCQPKEAA